MENDVVRNAVLAEAKKKRDEYISQYVKEMPCFKHDALALFFCLLVIPMGVGALLFSFSWVGITLGVAAVLGGFLSIRYGFIPRLKKMLKEISDGFEQAYPAEAEILKAHQKECKEKGGCCCCK
jgi:Flp pilus assembly protein TadB